MSLEYIRAAHCRRGRSLAAEALEHLRAADGDPEAIAEAEAFLARR
jgi:hypothetical protein